MKNNDKINISYTRILNYTNKKYSEPVNGLFNFKFQPKT